MKVNEYLTQAQTTGFLPVMENVYPETYKAIFGTIDPMLLDTNICMMYGNRDLIAVFTNDNAATLIKSVIILKADGWVKQANALNIDYDLLQPLIGKQVTTISENVDETNTGSDTKQSTTFNDSNFGDDERNEQSDNSTRKSEKTQSIESSGIGDNKSVVEVISEEIKLRKKSLQIQVINELISELILSIY